MADTNLPTSKIKSEEEFQDIIASERENRTKTDYSTRFENLANALHDALKKQDSEAALTLITK
jgi:hypothetical protein